MEGQDLDNDNCMEDQDVSPGTYTSKYHHLAHDSKRLPDYDLVYNIHMGLKRPVVCMVCGILRELTKLHAKDLCLLF